MFVYLTERETLIGLILEYVELAKDKHKSRASYTSSHAWHYYIK